MRSARVAILGGDDLRASVIALGFEPTEIARAQVAVVDARDRAQLAAASVLPQSLPRLTVAAAEDAPFFAAIGLDSARVVTSIEPARIGPALVALIPRSKRGPTKLVVITGVRGGVGRTLLTANLALRIAKRLRVCAIDATGTGALAWWLRASPKPWSDAEAIAAEMSEEHLPVIADAGGGARVVGGPGVAPSAAALHATVRVTTAIDDLVIVDAPLASDANARVLADGADRRVVLAYDDPCSALLLEADPPRERDWLIAAQSRRPSIAGHTAFRALPRDESAVASSASSRSQTGGALGRAYDDLAELVTIDATDA